MWKQSGPHFKNFGIRLHDSAHDWIAAEMITPIFPHRVFKVGVWQTSSAQGAAFFKRSERLLVFLLKHETVIDITPRLYIVIPDILYTQSSQGYGA